MPRVRTRDGIEKHEPYPLSEFPAEVIQSICKRIVHIKAVGHADITGDHFSRIFADSISGQSYRKPVGIADVSWNGCCWSVKTVQHKEPHKVKSIRLISGRNSPVFSSGITDPFADLQATGQSVLDVYNERINKAKWDHDDTRMVVLLRNMRSQEFTLFERPIAPFVIQDYTWELNKRRNFMGMRGDTQVFTWQPHGSQFTIHEPIPPSATKFKINREPGMLKMQHVLRKVGFNPDWVEVL